MDLDQRPVRRNVGEPGEMGLGTLGNLGRWKKKCGSGRDSVASRRPSGMRYNRCLEDKNLQLAHILRRNFGSALLEVNLKVRYRNRWRSSC